MESIFATAAIWVGLALVACLISKRLGITLALVQILVGLAAGNLVQLDTSEWVTFLASTGSIMLTFLAGIDISPAGFKKNLASNLTIGILSFLAPFILGLGVTYFLLGWDLNAAKIAGIALSTTSVAVVYSVVNSTGLNKTELGQSILSICFVTDIGTVLLLGVIFTGFSEKMLVLILVTVIIAFFGHALCDRVYAYLQYSGTEGDSLFIILLLLGLGGVAVYAGSEAVLPAYVLGLALSNFFSGHPHAVQRLQTIAAVAFVPFFFIKAGAMVSLPAVANCVGLVVLLFFVKIAGKFIGVLPSAEAFKFGHRNSTFMTLLASTGLTFGTIAAQYGLTHNYITAEQYAVLVVVIVSTAVIPTIIAQKFCLPREGETGTTGFNEDAKTQLQLSELADNLEPIEAASAANANATEAAASTTTKAE